MRLGRLSLAIVCLSAVNLVCPVAASALSLSKQTVNDVSWPNCNLSPVNLSSFGIVGVSGGLDFRNNPCLAKEASWFNHYALYINTGYPGSAIAIKYQKNPLSCAITNNVCLAYDYGYNATTFALNYAASQLVSSTSWWLDVETDNSWSNSYQINVADLSGALAALNQKTLFSMVGFYSSPDQWAALTNNWTIQYPEWVATGSSSPTVAKSACSSKPFTGGSIWLSQYTTKLDTNVVCDRAFISSFSRPLGLFNY